MDNLETPKSAQSAFENNPIPTIRTFEKQLHANVLRDKERLRALVGGNYRDLLSTAEEIVSLDRRTKNAESQISELSQRCKPPVETTKNRQTSTLSSVCAQLRLLIQCINCASSALQNRSILLCAELTVVSRLLLKSLNDQSPQPKSIEALRNKAAALRRRLIRLISSQLVHPASSLETLVQAVCAYCLVTSASSGDAVEHFRKIRLDKLKQRIALENGDQSRVKEDFHYLVASVHSLKSLLGRSVNDALSILQKQPILHDQNIIKLEALDIDRLHNLIPSDILAFTPYIKRVLLKQDEVQKVINSWVAEACELFSESLKNVLNTTKSVVDILMLRKELYSIILPVYFSTHAREAVVESIRQTTNTRILQLCEAQIVMLVKVGHTLISEEPGTKVRSPLWELSLVQGQLASNSAAYTRQVRSSHLGTTGGLTQPIKKIRNWGKQVHQFHSHFKDLESTRWQDLLEEPDDEDEEAAQRVVHQLSKDDPSYFRQAMHSNMQNTISQFNQLMHDAVTAVSSVQENSDTSENISQVVHLVRALRESSVILASVVPEYQIETKELASKLHIILAERVSQQILTSLKSDSATTHQHTIMPDDLPSPPMFKMLRDICTAMTYVGGTDIWSAAAVSSLKKKLWDCISDQDVSPIKFRTDFDKYYLQAALNHDPSSDKVTNSDEILSKANAYWQRTKLLFGVLA